MGTDRALADVKLKKRRFVKEKRRLAVGFDEGCEKCGDPVCKIFADDPEKPLCLEHLAKKFVSSLKPKTSVHRKGAFARTLAMLIALEKTKKVMQPVFEKYGDPEIVCAVQINDVFMQRVEGYRNKFKDIKKKFPKAKRGTCEMMLLANKPLV